MRHIDVKTFLSRLVAYRDEPCLSIYMPTQKVTGRRPKNRIVFKNLLREARDCLIDYGLRPVEARDFLAPAAKLLKDALFWEYQGNGLALFLSRDIFEQFFSPIAFDKRVSVAHRFYLKSLLPLLYGGDHFFLLAVSMKEVRLFRISASTLDEIHSEEAPAAVFRRSPKRQIQVVAGSQPGGSGQAAVFHGYGSGAKEDKSGLLQYLRHVADVVSNLLGDERAPMILAGLDQIRAAYSQVNRYPYLVESSIAGNPYSYSREELHRTALAAMEPQLKQWRGEVLTRFALGDLEGRISTDVAPILQAAADGGVEVLLVSSGAELFARHDFDTGRVDLHTEYQAGDVDILDEAVVRTMLTGGEVYCMEEDEMPAHLPIAALLRKE